MEPIKTSLRPEIHSVGEIIKISLKDHRVIAEKCFVAERFFDRLKGWIGRSHIEAGEGILFPRCNSVHMWFMSIPIDIVFLKKTKSGCTTISSIHPCARPWKIFPLLDIRAADTLELPAGVINQLSLTPGLEVQCIN